MSLQRPTPPGTGDDSPAPGRGLVVALGVLACAVIGHAVIVDWRPSPGGNPWLVPVIASTLILACALLLGLRLKGASSDDIMTGMAGGRRSAGGIALATLLTASWGLGFFHAVQALGLIAATFLFTAAGMLALSPRPRRDMRIVLPLTVAVAAGFWLLFTRLAPVVLGDPLLW